MNWVESVKHKHSLSVFEKRANKVRFPHAFIDMDKAKRVGFIVNMNQFESRDLIVLTDYITKLEENGKTVLIIELNYKRKTEPMFSETVRSIFINPENINWLGFPSLGKLKDINKFKLDILLNLDTSERMTAKFICGLSNSTTRVGIYEEGYENYYELMLDISGETALKNMLFQFETYLKMIEK